MVFAMMSGQNDFVVHANHFISACQRFGLDSPYPCVNAKVFMYGNDLDVREVLKHGVQDTDRVRSMAAAHHSVRKEPKSKPASFTTKRTS